MDGQAREIDRIVREVLAERRGAAVRSDPLQRVAADRLKAVTTNRAPQSGRGAPAGGDESCACGCGKTTGVGQREQTLRLDANVVTLPDLEGRLDGRRTLVVGAKSVLTPSALDYLRANGVAVERRDGHAATATARWAYAIDESTAEHGRWSGARLATAVVEALSRDGTSIQRIEAIDAKALAAECGSVLRTERAAGVVVFAAQPAVLVCLCNRDPQVRAVLATAMRETAEAVRSIAANVLVVDPAGRPFYELRQMVRAFCTGSRLECLAGCLRSE